MYFFYSLISLKWTHHDKNNIMGNSALTLCILQFEIMSMEGKNSKKSKIGLVVRISN